MLYNIYYEGKLLQKSISPESAAELMQLYADAYYEDPAASLDPMNIKLEQVFED
jgi:hypothetical protein